MDEHPPLDVHDGTGTGSGPGGPSLPGGQFRVGPYRALERLGVGATAQTWAGVDERSGRPVALKVFGPGGLEAARREATLAEVVDHPHLPEVLDVVADPHRPTLVTELATGGTLAALLMRAGRLSVGETLTVLVPVASALATAHERQVVHGDVSTHNIVLDAVGRPLLIDLGAGHALAAGGRELSVTPCHAAPEAAAGAAPTAAADVFSLGSVARECLVGEPAWPATELDEVVRLADTGPRPDVPDSIGSAPLAALVRAMLRADPDRRPGAAGLVVSLRAAGRPRPLPMPRPPATAGGDDGRSDEARDLEDVHEPADPGAPAAATGLGGRPRIRERPLGEDPDPPGAAQALTRSRLVADQNDRPSQAVPPGRSGRRGRRGGGPREGDRGRRRWLTGLLTACALLGLVFAALGGLPGSGRPGAAGSTSPAADVTPSGAAVPVAGSVVPAMTGATGTPAVGDAGTGAPGPGPGPGAAGNGSPASSAAAAGSAASAAPAPEPAPSPDPLPPSSAVTETDVDWLTVVRTLSAERGRALSQGDPELLDLVYVAGPARAADLGIVEELRRSGTSVSGAAHEIVSAGVIGPVGPGTGRDTGSGLPGVRLLVTDRLPSYEVRDAGGRTVGRTAARDGAALVMTVVRTDQGYRIEEVSTA